MTIDSPISLETAPKFPKIDVKYEHIKPEESLLTVDGERLGQVLTEAGYPSSVLKPLIITDYIPMGEAAIARYDMYTNKVLINVKALAEDTKRIYRDTLEAIGEQPPDSVLEKNDLLTKIMNSRVFRTVFPVFWPYKMLKNPNVSYFQGNETRYRKYFRAAKNGTLMPGKPLQEQRERAKRHLGKLMEYAMQSSTGWIFAHEYEHANKRLGKNITIAALAATPFLLGTSLLLALEKPLEKLGQSTSESIAISSIAIMCAGVLFGAAKGRSLDEQASYDAGYKHFAKVMECFHINHDVFAREVLGETQQTDAPT